MRAEEIEPLAEEAFYKIFAMVPVRERVVLPPTNHSNEIAKPEREYGKLMSEVARAKSMERQAPDHGRRGEDPGRYRHTEGTSSRPGWCAMGSRPTGPGSKS
jgi:hypothetical protein